MTNIHDTADLVSKALRRAWQLGQTYWQQADSEYQSHWKKADATQATFDQLVEDTRAAILTSNSGAQPAPSMPSGLHSLETIRFWADVYTHPGDDNFRRHEMAAALLREYAELRAALTAETKP